MSRRKRLIATGAAAVVAVAALAATAVIFAPEPEFVPQYAAPEVPEGPKIAMEDPIVAAPAGTDLTDIVDVTDELESAFSGDLQVTRTEVQGGDEKFPYTVDDQCLLDWATANVAALAAEGAYEVISVCDRPTAVLAGPASADTKVLVYAAAEDTAPEGMRELLLEATGDRVAFAAVRSADGQAQLIAASSLPD